MLPSDCMKHLFTKFCISVVFLGPISTELMVGDDCKRLILSPYGFVACFPERACTLEQRQSRLDDRRCMTDLKCPCSHGDESTYCHPASHGVDSVGSRVSHVLPWEIADLNLKGKQVLDHYFLFTEGNFFHIPISLFSSCFAFCLHPKIMNSWIWLRKITPILMKSEG